MAKRVHSVSLKGFLHEDLQIEEINTKEETSEFYNLEQILREEFMGKTVSITIKEENPVEPA